MLRNVAELWRYRALVWALVCRHLSARYRGSVLGFFWSFLNPLCLIAVYALVFRYYMRFTQVENYTLFLFSGLLPWIWFSSGLLGATSSIASGGNLITKALFPPHVLPTVEVITNLANFLFALPLIIIFMLISGGLPTASLLALPFVILVEFFFLLGLSLAFSALNVYYRDIQHILGNLLTLWFFLCPIIYPAESIPERLRFTLLINPIAVFTQMYQGIFVHGVFPNLSLFAWSFVISLAVLLAGNLIFNRYREDLAELI